MGKSVEIEIRDSVVLGDVVGGDKIVNKTVVVHLHESELDSVVAIRTALKQQGQSEDAADRLIRAVLSDPALEARYETARLQRDQKRVDQLIDATILDHQRTGLSEDMVARLWATIDGARKTQDWLSFSKSGVTLLQLMHNRVDANPKLMELADELIMVARKDATYSQHVPIVRVYQAAALHNRYAAAVMDLNTLMMIVERSPLLMPLTNLHDELKKAIEYSTLSDVYARQAVDLSLELGDPQIRIYVLFAMVTLQSGHHLLYRNYLGRDGHELAERVRRTALVLHKLIEKSGRPEDVAMLNSNMAAFSLSTEEYQLAETLAIGSAERFTELGDAHNAKRSLSIASSARRREPSMRGMPSEEEMLAMPIDEIKSAVRSGVSRLAQVNGVDLEEPSIKEAVDTAFRDFVPERVLRYCENIDVDYTATPLAAALNLPQVGGKLIGCRKLRVARTGIDLDQTFEAFKDGLKCHTCEYRRARTPEWKP